MDVIIPHSNQDISSVHSFTKMNQKYKALEGKNPVIVTRLSLWDSYNLNLNLASKVLSPSSTFHVPQHLREFQSDPQLSIGCL
jgi:hypothetical protein